MTLNHITIGVALDSNNRQGQGASWMLGMVAALCNGNPHHVYTGLVIL
jgi:hypothetical protein